VTAATSTKPSADTAAEVWRRVAETTYAEIRDFLYEEAALLDDRRYENWFALLTQEIEYRVLGKVVRAASAPPLEFTVLDDRLADIRMRINQISNPKLTFAENPAPFTRRSINNIRAKSSPMADRYCVDSNLLMYRQDAAAREPYLISAARRDILLRSGDALRIAKRDVHLDLSVVASANLPTFL
jgi:3-phenylpropionate/cinnamic acid dioxygenase small subunit